MFPLIFYIESRPFPQPVQSVRHHAPGTGNVHPQKSSAAFYTAFAPAFCFTLEPPSTSDISILLKAASRLPTSLSDNRIPASPLPYGFRRSIRFMVSYTASTPRISRLTLPPFLLPSCQSPVPAASAALLKLSASATRRNVSRCGMRFAMHTRFARRRYNICQYYTGYL